MKNLVLIFLIFIIPTSVKAAIIASGNDCGNDCHWEIDDTGKMVISGSGEMANFSVVYDEELGWHHTTAPWKGYEKVISSLIVKEGITTIGRCAFYNMLRIGSVELPKSIETIGMNAFQGTYALDNITIPEGITNIPYAAFNHSNLASIIIPDSVTTIEGEAFSSCDNLKSIVISDHVTSIADSGFGSLSSQTSDSPLPDDAIIYCTGDLDKCKSNVGSLYAARVAKAEIKKDNGITYIYDSDGYLIGKYGKVLPRRIYTVEEAAKVSKPTGNKIMLRYK